jgi:dihydroneopterin aldolase
VERILIRDLKVFGRHGVSPEERERGQAFFIDVELELERSSHRDELPATVDYVAVIREAQEVNESECFQLLESFARALAGRFIERFEPVRRARVRVRKRLPNAVGAELDWVAVEVDLGRTAGQREREGL